MGNALVMLGVVVAGVIIAVYILPPFGQFEIKQAK